VFISPEDADSPSYGIIFENPDADELQEEGNVFIGKLDKRFVAGN
jgi:hypothetical protein